VINLDQERITLYCSATPSTQIISTASSGNALYTRVYVCDFLSFCSSGFTIHRVNMNFEFNIYSPSLESLPPPLCSITIADLLPEAVALVSKSEVPPLQCSPVHLHLPLPLLPCHTPIQVVNKGLQEAIDALQHLSWLILLTLYHHLQ